MALMLLVGFGGFLGSIGRYSISLFINTFLSGAIPFSTLIINLLGSFAIGALQALIDPKSQSAWFYFLIPGLLGGFTTYSAFSGETFLLLQKNMYGSAFAYMSLTVLGGILFCALGFLFARIF